jgi:hypothetical protein
VFLLFNEQIGLVNNDKFMVENFTSKKCKL